MGVTLYISEPWDDVKPRREAFELGDAPADVVPGVDDDHCARIAGVGGDVRTGATDARCRAGRIFFSSDERAKKRI